MVTITCYGGVGEIGGNKFLVKDQDTKFFLDFGKNYSKENDYYDPPYIQARCTEHLLGLKILPDIKNIYKFSEQNSSNNHDISGVLISHPHGDHYDYVRFLKNDIPIHCGEGTKEIIAARECSGTKGPTREYYLCNLTKKNGYEEFKKFETFHSCDKMKVGDVKYTPIHVDHSVCGAYGYILETSSGLIAYTGDFRLHGPMAEMTREFVSKMKSEPLELLLIEGTNIDSSRLSSESEVQSKAMEVVKQTKGLVLTGFSMVDFDRFRTFYEIAKKTNRRFTITAKQAYILNKLQPYVDLPSITDENIRVFVKGKRTVNLFESEVIDNPGVKIIYAKDVNMIQNKILMVAGYYDFNELITIKPIPGSTYILSQSEPFNEEMEIDYAKLQNWLELHGLPLFSIHASGHANANELKGVIAEVNPKYVAFIHTERPKLYERYIRDLGVNCIIPKEGEEIII
jgi:ribonuclease J